MKLKLTDVKIEDICQQLRDELEMHLDDINSIPTFDETMLWLNSTICINIDADSNNQIQRMYLGNIEEPIGLKFTNKDLQCSLQLIYNEYVKKQDDYFLSAI